MCDKDPATLDPNDKWFCNHSCGFEPADDGEGPGHCYDCGHAEPPHVCNHKFVTHLHHGVRCFYCNARPHVKVQAS